VQHCGYDFAVFFGATTFQGVDERTGLRRIPMARAQKSTCDEDIDEGDVAVPHAGPITWGSGDTGPADYGWQTCICP